MSYGLAFWIFIAITVLRQVHYFWHQSEQKKINKRGHAQTVRDQRGSQLLSVLYVIIWFGAIYELYTNEFLLTWYILGLILVIVGSLVRAVALRNLGKSYGHEVVIWPDHQLITHGVYGWVRHPLYLALIIELLGMVVVGREVWLLIVWVSLLFVLTRRIRIEDKALMRLGEHAQQYQTSVPALNVLSWLFRSRKNKTI